MKSNRILGLDVARALAILGMMFVNYHIVFNVGDVENPLIGSFLSLFEGRAVAVFLILAGVGIGLMTKQAYEHKEKEKMKVLKKALMKRAAFLFVLGMLLMVLFDWTADILHYYGVFMIMIIPFLNMDKKALIFSSILFVFMGLMLQFNLNYQYGWDESYNSYMIFYTPIGFLSNTFFNGYHPVFPWFSFILTGLALSRFNLSKPSNQVKGLMFGLMAAIGLEFVSWWMIDLSNQSELIIYLFDTKPMNPSALYVFAATAWAMAFINAILIVSEKKKDSRTMSLLIKTGQMALTHYVGHSVIVLSGFYIFNQLTHKSEAFVLLLSLIVFTFMVITSWLWSKAFNRGPLEMLMRRISG
ncbi:MAG: DUF1624 domain-containing protein [Clostridia bacterium]|nr:DUF1624 domain-containing protein [Clostridia bacterium]